MDELTNIKLDFCQITRDLGHAERQQGQEKICLDCCFQLISLVLLYFGYFRIYGQKPGEKSWKMVLIFIKKNTKTAVTFSDGHL